jgi:N-acetylglucosaminyldiphosphoundecaprenol N-acetyl-beta-D-mannosaminyltransferase
MRTRFRIGGIPIDGVSQAGALERIKQLVLADRGGVVVTPNVDHIVLAQHDAEFVNAYESADLSLVDGMPVLWLARLLGHAVPEKVSGADLIRPLLETAARSSFRVYLLGGAEGSAILAKERLASELPDLNVVGVDAPPIDLDAPSGKDDSIIERILQARPNLLVVGLGAPKQEIWIHRHRHQLGSIVSLGLGACIDLLAGRVQRAPSWASKAGLEWACRLLREPQRLGSRYLLRDPAFLGVTWREIIAHYVGRCR